MNDTQHYDPETLQVGDRVRHVDYPGAGIIIRFPWYPDAVVQWESTGRESTVNLYYLTPAE